MGGRAREGGSPVGSDFFLHLFLPSFILGRRELSSCLALFAALGHGIVRDVTSIDRSIHAMQNREKHGFVSTSCLSVSHPPLIHPLIHPSILSVSPGFAALSPPLLPACLPACLCVRSFLF
mmetsp:Transcript_25355/g.73222  ORF Transcript_25355/g.73222 Transcript_25355/m.73222 type:complete len:121 (-) Transcript_25355:292-654(-)